MNLDDAGAAASTGRRICDTREGRGKFEFEDDLDAIAAELNERPRKTLDWDSPAEAYAHVVRVATTE